MVALDQLWERLGHVRSLSFVASSGKPNGWNGQGTGTVVVLIDGKQTLTFTESGTWRSEGGRDTRFSNVYRWTVIGETIRLEHLRFGQDRPVNLFDLAQTGEREWRSVSPHLCSEDCYAATMLVLDDRIILRWSIDGPRKQVMIEYVYSVADAAP